MLSLPAHHILSLPLSFSPSLSLSLERGIEIEWKRESHVEVYIATMIRTLYLSLRLICS